MQKWLWFTCGMLIGLTALSISRASVPRPGQLTDDTAIYQSISEIHVKKEAQVDFDADINRLARLEPHFNERLQGPLARISKEKYRPSQKLVTQKVHGSRVGEKKTMKKGVSLSSQSARANFMNRQSVEIKE